MNYGVKIKDGFPYINSLEWYLDADRSVREAFISHAHYDHFSRHKIGHCSVETGIILQGVKEGPDKLRTHKMGRWYESDGCRFSLLPAGHIFGSSQLLVECEKSTILFSGDIRPGGSRTCSPAATPSADLLIVEGTYADPAYSHLSLAQAEERAFEFMFSCAADGAFPVFVSMSRIGKGQDLLKALGDAGYAGLLQLSVYLATERCAQAGMELPQYLHWKSGTTLVGDFLIITASYLKYQRAFLMAQGARFAYISGWAADKRGRYDAHIPWSDHADLNGLLAFVESVNPREVWTFDDRGLLAEQLRKRGRKATSLDVNK